jgi:hypothetical protein
LPTKSQYDSISFVEPGATDVEVHQNVATNNAGKNLTLDVQRLANETREAMADWFESLQHDHERKSQVASRLNRVARVQAKQAHVPIITADGNRILSANGDTIGIVVVHRTTSST